MAISWSVFGGGIPGICVMGGVIGGFILGIVAVVLGFAARRRVKHREADNGGVAVAGIVLGIVAIIAAVIFTAIAVDDIYVIVPDSDWQHCMGEHMGDAEACHQIVG